jgi:hypothetical protein
MIPFLTYPLALLALAALPALAAIYLFRNRFRRRQVSSLMLWRFQLQSKTGGAKIHRLQMPLIFFIELLALLLLVTAATGPRWNLPQSARPMVVILDDSISMRAGANGKTPRSRGVEFLERSIKAQRPPTIRLLAAGTEPRVLGPPVHSWAEVRELLEEWTCWSPAASLGPAMILASQLGSRQANVLVISDHPPEDKQMAGGRIQWHSFGVRSDNLAFVNASRVAHGDEDRCLLEVSNFSPAQRTARLEIATGTNPVQLATLPIGPRDRQRVVFNIPSSASVLRASLEPDALAEDNQVQLLPPVRKRVRVRVAVTNEPLAGLISRTLEATGLRSAISEDPELVIHQSLAELDRSGRASTLGTNAWSLRWLSGGETSAHAGPFLVDPAHPLTQGIALHGAVWAAPSVSPGAESVPLVLSGNAPLLWAREDVHARRHISLALDPELSTVQNTPDWPILFWNLLQWRADQSPGLRENNFRLGADVLLHAAGEPVQVTSPGGGVETIARTGAQLLLDAPLPGVYSVTMGAAAYSFSVNPIAPEESDLAECATGNWGSWQDAEERRFAYGSVLWIFVLAALSVMVCHLVLVTRAKGGA